jgi:hypothetical protein
LMPGKYLELYNRKIYKKNVGYNKKKMEPQTLDMLVVPLTLHSRALG